MIIEKEGIIWKFTFENLLEECNFLSSRDPGVYYVCEFCETALATHYSLIIKLLDDANLLPKNYKHLCCLCSVFEKLGILDLKDYFNMWGDDEGSILYLYFTNHNNDGKLEIRVHDYKKVLFS